MSERTIENDTIKCLDHGFVRLVDHMGGDDAIVQSARVSYGKGTKKVTQDRGLIRYLMRHRHTTPFEMVEFKFHCKMPIFIARQWVRHRTANINEYSLRYSEASEEFYLPKDKDILFQSMTNKQGRSINDVPPELKNKVRKYFEEISKLTYEAYQDMNQAGIARELARGILPVNLYTEWYWKNDLHNIFHFLHLRMDSHAQYEIRVFANAMASYVKKVAPIAYEAFEDYIVKGLRFSGVEQDIFTRKLPPRVIADLNEDVVYRILATMYKSKTRSEEELWKLYLENGGTDTKEDFDLKWASGEVEPGNIRELREFQEKLSDLK